jgi:hypothetical protein
MNANRLKALKKGTSMQAIKNAGYAGIIIDATKIDGAYNTMIKLFNQTFKQAKNKGL